MVLHLINPLPNPLRVYITITYESYSPYKTKGYEVYYLVEVLTYEIVNNCIIKVFTYSSHLMCKYLYHLKFRYNFIYSTDNNFSIIITSTCSPSITPCFSNTPTSR